MKKQPKDNWYQRKKQNDVDNHLLETKNGKISVKEMFKLIEEERNGKQ